MADIHPGAGHQDLRRDEGEADVPTDRKAGDRRQLEHSRVLQRAKHVRLPARRETCVLQRQFLHDPAALIVAQPAGRGWRIRKQPEHRDSKDDRRHALEQEQPLPPAQPSKAVQPEQPPGQEAPDHRRHSAEAVEAADRTSAVRRRVPAGDVVQAGWPEARFGRSEEQPHYVELDRGTDEHHGRGEQPPADHDPNDPAARADTRHHHPRRDFEHRVRQEEKAAAESVDGGGELQVDVHLRRREADVQSVEVAAEVSESEQGDDAP